MRPATDKDLSDRVLACLRAWGVSVERTAATRTSLLAYGRRGGAPCVLKVVKQPGDEWRCGEIAAAFAGRGVVQVYEHRDGAALFERLDPGEPLAALTHAGRDDEATDVLAMLLGRMSPHEPPADCATIERWGEGFGRYRATEDERVPQDLLAPAERIYAELCVTQRNPALLHGDLHHYNVLSDRSRGWCAIDPKGVVGELEFELGAALRNPVDRPELFVDLDVVERRLDHFGLVLGIDTGRARGWCFAQAVLAAIWTCDEPGREGARAAWLALARGLLASPALRADYLD